jgi:hypothetical protein
MSLSSINGYPAIVWRQVLNILTYAQTNVSASGQLSTQQQLADAIATSFRWARDSIDAYAYAQAWATEYELLAPILTFNLGLNATDQGYIVNRIAAVQGAAEAATVLYGAAFKPLAGLLSGIPSIPNPGLVEFLMQFSYETAPDAFGGDFTDDFNSSFSIGVSTDYPALFQTSAQAQYQAWVNCVTALQTSGVSAGLSLDAAQRQVTFSSEAATAVSNITISAATLPTTMWNLLISMPVMCRIGDAYLADPTSADSQQLNIARLVILDSLDQFNILISNISESVPANVRTINVRANDTLVKIAARELGNFELWPSLAALNGLNPPYISTTVGSGVIAVGQPLFIPTGQVTASTIYQPINSQLSYELDYLGTDIYLGPMSQPTMNPWTGDFQTIYGYNNLANALDRRLITPITALIYHPEYGSRIPGEIGNAETTQTAGYTGAYAQSAVMTDLRVQTVTDVVVRFPQFGTIEVSLTAIPNGNQTNDVTVSSLISPPASSNVT